MDSIGSMLFTRYKSHSGWAGSQFKDFGAAGDGKHDDIEALEHARDWVIKHPAVLNAHRGLLYQPAIYFAKYREWQGRFYNTSKGCVTE